MCLFRDVGHHTWALTPFSMAAQSKCPEAPGRTQNPVHAASKTNKEHSIRFAKTLRAISWTAVFSYIFWRKLELSQGMSQDKIASGSSDFSRKPVNALGATWKQTLSIRNNSSQMSSIQVWSDLHGPLAPRPPFPDPPFSASTFSDLLVFTVDL